MAPTKSELEKHADSLLSSFIKQPPLTSGEAAERIKEMTGIVRSTQTGKDFYETAPLKVYQVRTHPLKSQLMRHSTNG